MMRMRRTAAAEIELHTSVISSLKEMVGYIKFKVRKLLRIDWIDEHSDKQRNNWRQLH